MKIVIDIPDNVYKFVTTECKDVAISETKAPIEYIIRGIIDGTPLPKGHGDLIDEKNLLDKWNNLSVRGRTEFDQVIMCQPPVIPSDKGE